MPTSAKTFSQRCPSRHRSPDRRASAARRGYDRDWQATRETVLREEPTCTFCPALATVVDHVVPLSQAGARLDRDNLRPVCRDCHAALTGELRRTGRNELPASPAARPAAAPAAPAAGGGSST